MITDSHELLNEKRILKEQIQTKDGIIDSLIQKILNITKKHRLKLIVQNVHVKEDGDIGPVDWSFRFIINGNTILETEVEKYNNDDPQPFPIGKEAGFEVSNFTAINGIIEANRKGRTAIGTFKVVARDYSQLNDEEEYIVHTKIYGEQKKGYFIFKVIIKPPA